MVKSPPSNAGDVSSIPDWGTKIPQAVQSKKEDTVMSVSFYLSSTQIHFLSKHVALEWLWESGESRKLSWDVFNFGFSSVAQSCLTLCDPMNHSMPGLPVHHQPPEFTQTHVH